MVEVDFDHLELDIGIAVGDIMHLGDFGGTYLL